MLGRNNVGGLIGDAVVGDVAQGKTFSSLAAGKNKTGTYLPFNVGDNNQITTSFWNTTSTSWVKVREIAVGKKGEYRVVFKIRREGGTTENAQGRIYKNGVAYGTSRFTPETSYVTFTEDLAFGAGDLCQLYCLAQSPASCSYGGFGLNTEEAKAFNVTL